jgi:hypothetical protein
MKNRDFDSLKRASAYLTSSVIRLGKTPIYIQKVEEGKNKKTSFVLKYNEVGAAPILTVNLGHPKINMNPVKLGWLSVNPDSKCQSLYLSRRPNRTWHAGLCANNLQMVYQYESGHVVSTGGVKNPSFFSKSKELRDTILGKYPSFEDAKKFAASHPKLFWPFSRNFALFGSDVYYRHILHPVGVVVDGSVVLNAPASTLFMEVLHEDLHG